MMSTVAIISRHAISNYGSLLQAYALERTIRDLGYDAKTIDYIREEEKSWHLCKVELVNSRWNVNLLKRAVFYTVNIPNRARQFSRFGKFRRELLHLTREYGSFDAIKKNPPKVDLYCTGSDQVWNETIYDKLDWTYFLTFLDNQKRIAYAASFGKGFIKEELKPQIHAELSKYNRISVREQSGQDILNSMGISGTVVLDPTLLLSHEKWEEVIGTTKVSQEKYILLYQIHKNNALVDYALRYGRMIGCKVINISVSFTQKHDGIEFKCLPSYQEVLALFRSAHCIVTDSFHATAFSINFNKKFVTILPKISASRIKSILATMGLESRVLTDTNDLDLPEKQIDYSFINPKLENLRKESIAWLDAAIKETLED